MANYCASSFAIHSPVSKNALEGRNELLKFYLKLTEVINFTDYPDAPSAINILESLGFTKEEIEELGVDGRTSIFGGTDGVMYREDADGNPYVEIQTESAWSPCVEFIEAIIHKLIKKDVSLDYMCEEPGMEIYINTDVTKKIFDAALVISYDVKEDCDTVYFGINDLDKAVELIKKITSIEDINITQLRDDLEYRKKITDSVRNDAGDYLTINFYEPTY